MERAYSAAVGRIRVGSPPGGPTPPRAVRSRRQARVPATAGRARGWRVVAVVGPLATWWLVVADHAGFNATARTDWAWDLDAVVAAIAATWPRPQADIRDGYPLADSTVRVFAYLPDAQAGRNMEVGLDHSGRRSHCTAHPRATPSSSPGSSTASHHRRRHRPKPARHRPLTVGPSLHRQSCKSISLCTLVDDAAPATPKTLLPRPRCPLSSHDGIG